VISRAASLLAVLLWSGTAACGQMPAFGDDGWHAWEVGAARPGASPCCHRLRGGVLMQQTCRLDGGNMSFDHGSAGGDDALKVYALVVDGAVSELCAYAASCPVTAASPITELGRVADDDSARFLAGLLDGGNDVAPEALMALSLQADDLARDRLIEAGRSNSQPDIRGDAWFWLAHGASADDEAEIRRAVESDPDAKVREEAVFALSQLPNGRDVPALAALVADRELRMNIRREAIFWLAQSDDDAAIAAVDRLLGIY